jgi:hypothetical protein
MPTTKQPDERGHDIMQLPYVDGKTTAHSWEVAKPGWRCTVCGAVAIDEMYLPRRNCHGKPTA